MPRNHSISKKTAKTTVHSPRLLTDGETLPGGYEVERFLGEGAFAEVYRVRHRFFGRQALKIFKEAVAAADEVEKKLTEAILLSRIGHPNIVRVFNADVLETAAGLRGFFTMEYVPGGTLHTFWQSYGDSLVAAETAVDIMRQICRGLVTAHGETPPVIHRDIKPQNILVGYEADGLRVRLSDFGLARQLSPTTLFASVAGTLAFKPPEAFKGETGDSVASDIYALGVTFYLLLTDVLPYDVDSPLGWIDETKFDTPAPPPSSINPSADAALDNVVARCIAVTPERRFTSAAELLAALDDWRTTPHDKPPPRKAALTGTVSKSVLGQAFSAPDDAAGQALAKRALSVWRGGGRLMEAADLMEEAFSHSPDLRERYASRVALWRAGISM